MHSHSQSFASIELVKHDRYRRYKYRFVKKWNMLLPQSVWALDKVGSVSVVVVWYEVDNVDKFTYKSLYR